MRNVHQPRGDRGPGPSGRRPAIASLAETTRAATKITALALLGLLTSTFGSPGIRAETVPETGTVAARAQPASWMPPGVGKRPAAGLGTSLPLATSAYTPLPSRSSSISSLMRRSGLSYLEKERPPGNAAPAVFAGPPALDAPNAPDTMAAEETALPAVQASAKMLPPAPMPDRDLWGLDDRSGSMGPGPGSIARPLPGRPKETRKQPRPSDQSEASEGRPQRSMVRDQTHRALATRHSLLPTPYSPRPTPDPPLPTPDSPLPTHHSPLTTHHSPPATEVGPKPPKPVSPPPVLPRPILPKPVASNPLPPGPVSPQPVSADVTLRQPVSPEPHDQRGDVHRIRGHAGITQTTAIAVREAPGEEMARARFDSVQEEATVSNQPGPRDDAMERSPASRNVSQVASSFPAAPSVPSAILDADFEPTPFSQMELVPSPAPEMDLRPIGAVTTNIAPVEGELPPDYAQARLRTMGEVAEGEVSCRGWPAVMYQWEAAASCHQPLYFEEINLERHGYMYCDHRWGGVPAALVQPVLSGAHFFATIPALPYKMTLHPAWEPIYTLGHYRPGSPVPHQIHRIPLRPLAGGAEAVAITGLIFALP